MKAIIYNEYGTPDVLHVEEIEKPIMKDNEVLVKIHAASVNYGDLLARDFKNTPASEFNMPRILWYPALLSFGLNKPRKNILGSEFSGEIEAIGKDVTQFTVGDAVFGYRGQSMGTYAQYICMPENGLLTKKPSNMTHAEAATVPYGSMTALNLLKKAHIQKGQKVLINGASGGIGSYAVQLARYYGAEVTGVCSTHRLDFVKSLGADKVIDYTQEDFTQNGETYDLIFDVLGRSSFSRCKDSLTAEGRYLLASFKMKQVFQMLKTSLAGSNQKVICALSMEKKDDLVFITELIEAGKINTIIDRSFPFEQAADAHRYIESGQKKGHVIINVA